MSDTVFAPATAAGRSAVAVVRLSGPRSGEALSRLTGRTLPAPRRATLRRLQNSEGEALDEALVLWMPGPESFTGEDCVELHLHGGPAVVAGVCDALAAEGLRLADPGEFTRKAFQNGRFDLSQAEAIGDLVAAETHVQRRQALAQYEGALSKRYQAWREALLDALALLEAGIDFPEDEDIPREIGASAVPLLQATLAEMALAVAETGGERVREGYRVALMGAPNVGKSSLLNALSGRDAAIVTDIAGTTRDVVEVSLMMGGQAIVMGDMAGFRKTDDVVEAEGVRRALAWTETADLRIGVVDCSRLETLNDVSGLLRAGDIVAFNKSDVVGELEVPTGAKDMTTLACSTQTTDGLVGLSAAICDRVGVLMSGDEFPAVTRARHRALLHDAIVHLERAISDGGYAAELAGEGVRLAVRSLERVTGRSDPEAVLDRVFAGFCIGK